MKIHIEQVLANDQFYVKITKSENFLNDVWGDLKRYLTNYEKDSIIEENKDGIITEWICLLSVLKELKDLKVPPLLIVVRLLGKFKEFGIVPYL